MINTMRNTGQLLIEIIKILKIKKKLTITQLMLQLKTTRRTTINALNILKKLSIIKIKEVHVEKGNNPKIVSINRALLKHLKQV